MQTTLTPLKNQPLSEHIPAILLHLRDLAETHPEGESGTVTRAACALALHDGGGKILHIDTNVNTIPAGLDVVLGPKDQLLDTNYADQYPEDQKPSKQCKSSPTRHPEVDLALHPDPLDLPDEVRRTMFINQICCPRCAAVIALSGVNRVIFDAQSHSNEWGGRRPEYIQMSMDILARAGVVVETVEPESPKQCLPRESGDLRDASSKIPAYAGKAETENFTLLPPENTSDIHKTAEDFHKSIPPLNPHMDYAAYATGVNARDGAPFAVLCTATLPPGFSADEYLSHFKPLETKYSLVIPPMTALLAHLKRMGIAPQNLHLGTTGRPTMRDLINVIGPLVETITIAPDDLDMTANIDFRTDTHKSDGQPYKIYESNSALKLVMTHSKTRVSLRKHQKGP